MSFSVNGPAKETIAGASDPNAKISGNVKPEGDGKKKEMVSKQMLGGLLADQVGRCNAISVPLVPPMGSPIGGAQQPAAQATDSKVEEKESGGFEVKLGGKKDDEKKAEDEKKADKPEPEDKNHAQMDVGGPIGTSGSHPGGTMPPPEK